MNYLTFAFYFELLSHPLIILVIGAALSGLVIPHVTNKWKDKVRQIEITKQDYQRELEIKKEITGNIAQSVMTVLVYIRAVYKKIEATKNYIKKNGLDNNSINKGNTSSYTSEFATLIQNIDVTLEELNKKFNDFEISRGIIGTTLKTYFPNSNLYYDWIDFLKKMDNLYDKINENVEIIKKR